MTGKIMRSDWQKFSLGGKKGKRRKRIWTWKN
jgi:hypothetical protein